MFKSFSFYNLPFREERFISKKDTINTPEEVAWRQGWINSKDVINLAKNSSQSGYGNYLMNLISESKLN